MNRLLILLALALGLLACQPKGQIYAEHQELSPGLEWLKQDVREFKVPIEDTGISYNMSLSFPYLNSFEPHFVKVKVTEISPAGAEVVKEYELKVREDNGDYIGEFAYEIWDSKHVIEPDKKYSKPGLYTYLIEHNMDADPLKNAMEIGVILERVK
jgi:gliding motility-associated lipoprotein GldH